MRKVLVVIMLAAAVAVILFGRWLVQMRDTYGEWRLTATETPARITALGRDYSRSGLSPEESVPGRLVRHGETAGGGLILVRRGPPTLLPLVIYVEDDAGQLWTYGLIGGP